MIGYRTTAEAAAVLGVSEATVKRRLASGALQGTKAGRTWLVSSEALLGPLVVSYSELDTFRQCALKHDLAYKQRWVRPQIEGGPLAKGSLWHAVLERHYQVVQSRASSTGRIMATREEDILKEARYEVAKLLSDNQSGQSTDTQDLIAWMYRGHVALYGADRDWKVLEIEYKNEIPLVGSRFLLKAKIDLIVENREGRMLVVDHKSCSRLPSDKELDIDDQFGLYVAALKVNGWPVFGAVHSAARTQRNDGDKDGTKIQPLPERFRRSTSYRSAKELTAILEDAKNTATAAWSDHAPYSSPNSDTCKWKCDFLEAHLANRKGTPWPVVLRDFQFEQNFERH